ncbi:MAG TPA: DUF2203 domain-containing protein [Kofleriaceae bacterium]|nr:DUF2203 domain-containing protein [Kofleriaceae bacterium]
MRRHYTVSEVNAFIPEVTRRWAAALELRAQLRRHHARLEEAGYPASEKLPDDASPEVRRDHLVLLGLRDALRDELAAIGATGCVVRDLDTGLCDWLGAYGGLDVWLCWRVGESECTWFHGIEDGFAGRRPITELVPEPPAPLPPARVRR